jgi:hypothetical protein
MWPGPRGPPRPSSTGPTHPPPPTPLSLGRLGSGPAPGIRQAPPHRWHPFHLLPASTAMDGISKLSRLSSRHCNFNNPPARVVL